VRLGAPALPRLGVLIPDRQEVREERCLAVVAWDRRGLPRRWGDRDERAAFRRGPVTVVGGQIAKGR